MTEYSRTKLPKFLCKSSSSVKSCMIKIALLLIFIYKTNRIMKLHVGLIVLLTCLTLVNSETLHLRREGVDILHDQNLNSPTTLGSSGNLGGGIAGFIFGPILFILSFICIFNNQKKAAIDYRRMKLAETIVNEVNPFDVQQMRQADGKLVHVTGDSQCNETLVDKESGITLNGAIKLKRDVEVRQMRQTGSNQNRRLEPMWVSQNQPSASGYVNDPGAWFIGSNKYVANNVNIGNYLLSPSLKQSLPYNTKYNPTIENAYAIARGSQGRVKNQPIINNGYIYFPSVPGGIEAPGTLRVSYSYCPTGETSIISQSSQNSFVPFRIDIAENGVADKDHMQGDGCCCCLLSDCTADLLAPIKELDLITQRKESFHEMFEHEKKIIDTKKNLIRLASYFLMVFSICAFLSPITTILGYVPLLGGLLSGIVGLAIFLAALIICIPLFLLAVAVSWLIFHPKVGIIILGVALLITGLVFLIIQLTKPKGNTDASAQAAKHLIYSMRSFLEQ